MRVNRHTTSRAKGRFGFAAACALVACIPTAGLAVGALNGGVSAPDASAALAKFTPASADPRVAQLVARSAAGKGQLMRFTPAGVPDQASGSVTVAVRVDADAARAISARSALAGAQDQQTGAAPALSLAPVRYNLGLARGYQSFVKAAPAPAPAAISRTLSDAAIPDLAAFRPAPAQEEESRFAAANRTAEPRVAAAPRAIASSESAETRAVDLAGSYRLTRNLDVTAGVRYAPTRDRLAPVADTAQKDNQAVYIGTQFRF